VAIDVAESILENNEDLLDLVGTYYNEIRNRRSNRISGEINTAIRDLNYESIQENFQLINESYKVPVFVEFDEQATQIWQRFVNLMDIANGRPSRTNFLQIKNAMEQYMIGISEDDVNAAGLEQVSGIFKIDIAEIERLYDEIIGFHGD
jgi:CRISPR-associated endonuclease/helicase Cas3